MNAAIIYVPQGVSATEETKHKKNPKNKEALMVMWQLARFLASANSSSS